jgi:hypothetical protein
MAELAASAIVEFDENRCPAHRTGDPELREGWSW